MKVWVYVEGPSDVVALNALWGTWKESLRLVGTNIECLPLDSKAKYFRKIGSRAAEKLMHNDRDIVVGLPDLYPTNVFDSTEYKHKCLRELSEQQSRLVRHALKTTFGRREDDVEEHLNRFLGSALRHDLEMLLLAAKEALRTVLGTRDQLGSWRHPVEDQNLDKPPKRVVEDLFLHRSAKGRAYRDTSDAPRVLKLVSDSLGSILVNEHGSIECPEFKRVLDWIGHKTGVPAYTLSPNP